MLHVQAVEAIWELLDACVNGYRLQSAAAEERVEGGDSEPLTLGGWQPRCRWYDARCDSEHGLSSFSTNTLTPALTSMGDRPSVDVALDGRPAKREPQMAKPSCIPFIVRIYRG